MRYLVLTDIHANLEALEACLADARARLFDRTLLLGDIVGYGADPNAVVARVMELAPAALVRGNHDKAACGLEAPDGFNAAAQRAALWTRDTLTPEHRAWLAALPEGPRVVDELIEICHGTPFDEDAYVFDDVDALRALKAARRALCLFGHTHHPAIFEQARGVASAVALRPPSTTALELQRDVNYFVNPGAVGQPRDGDPRAAYAVVDTARGHIELRRVGYRVEEAQAKVRKAGLPESLAARLAVGR